MCVAVYGQQGKPGRGPQEILWALASLMAFIMLMSWLAGGDGPGKEVSWQEFRNSWLALGKVHSLEVVNSHTVLVRTAKKG